MFLKKHWTSADADYINKQKNNKIEVKKNDSNTIHTIHQPTIF